MSLELQRPKWEIDKRLEALTGENIRVRAAAFCPPRWTGKSSQLIEARAFILPDNSAMDGDALYLEGRLLSFRREIGVVFVSLDRPDADATANGRVLFRGSGAVILPGPATVRLHTDLFIERIAADTRLYWSHLLATEPQINLPFDD